MLTKQMGRVAAIFLVASLAALVLIGHGSPAHAQTQANDYSLTNLVAEDPTTTGYGDTTAGFHVTFTHPNPLPPNGSNYFALILDGTNNGYLPSGSSVVSPTITTINFKGISALSLGSHQFLARIYVNAIAQEIVSNTATITIGKGEVARYFRCSIHNPVSSYKPGQSLLIDFDIQSQTGSVPVDWQNGTLTITFKGPITVAETHLVPNANEQVTATAPTTTGTYVAVCSFDGSPHFNGGGSGQDIAPVSQGQHTGTVQLYTNPTPLQPNQPTTWYVVIPAGPGLPSPTGVFRVSMGMDSTNQITLSSKGDATFQYTFPSADYGYGSLEIFYLGDGVYTSARATFPLNNPPIPGAGGGEATPGPTVTAGGTATPGTPVPTVTVGTTGTPIATPAATPVAGAASTKTDGPTGPGTLPLLGGALSLLAVAGGGTLLWRRLGAAPASPAEHVWRQEPTNDDTAKLPTPRADWGD